METDPPAAPLPEGQASLLQEAHDQLRESEEIFRSMYTAAATGIALSTPDGRYLQANAAYCRMLGYTEAELQTRNFASVTHPDDLGRSLQLREEIMAGTRDSFVIEKRYLRKDGGKVWTWQSVSASRAASGEIKTLIVIAEDITEQKEAEAALRWRTALFEAQVHASLDAIIVVDREGKKLIENEHLAAVWKDPPEFHGEVNQRRRLEWIATQVKHPEKFAEKSARIFAHSEEVSQDLLELNDGRFVEMFTSPVRGPEGESFGRIWTYRDITERKRAEQALILFRALIDQSSDAIEVLDPATFRFLDVNEGACLMHGYTRAEMLALSVPDLDPDRSPEMLARVEAGVRYGQRLSFESRHRRKDGTIFPVEVTLKLVQLDRSYLVATVHDITERKRTEARFRRLLDSNVQGVLFWNKQGAVIGGNDAFLKLAGYSRAELEAGRIRWDEMTPPEYRQLDERALQELAATGVCALYEKELITKQGTRVPILLGSAVFEDNPEEGVCFMLDLTERKRSERDFLRAQRMESIGTLAGGIAHDLNNCLSPVIMALDILATKFTDADSEQLLGILGTSARRGAAMVRQILSFARGVEGEQKELQLKHLVAEVQTIARDTFPKDIVIGTALPSDLWTVLGDATQLHQLLLNLCVNARDAMPQGGRLTITGENVAIDAHYAGLSADAQAGPYVALKVEDTGMGIAPGDLHKIFEPFFTTKEIGKGTGLGLSTTAAIIKSHGGFVRVYSEVSKGTQFNVYLPAIVDAAAAIEDAKAVELPCGCNELILVVDDEPAVRTITQLTLEAYGYRAIFANDGAEAVMVFAARAAEIAAVVTDIMMPVMDGTGLIQLLLRMKPGLPIIAASGLSSNAHVLKVTGMGVRHFLWKPYTAEALLTALKELLDEKRR